MPQLTQYCLSSVSSNARARFRYTTRGLQQVKQEPVKRAPPGAVFADAGQKSKPKSDNLQAAVKEVSQKMAEIKVSSRITGEQIEEEERAKRARKLRKQLREIEALEEKAAAGGVLEKEQREKVARKAEIGRQVEELEA